MACCLFYKVAVNVTYVRLSPPQISVVKTSKLLYIYIYRRGLKKSSRRPKTSKNFNKES